MNCSKVVCIWCTFDGVLDPRDPDSVKTHYPIVPNMHAQMYKSQSLPSLPPLPKTSSGLLMKSKMKMAVVGGQVACNCATVLLIINQRKHISRRSLGKEFMIFKSCVFFEVENMLGIQEKFVCNYQDVDVCSSLNIFKIPFQ